MTTPPNHNTAGQSCHMSHCNQGEYEGSCKYGEADTCPAFTADQSGADIPALIRAHTGINKDQFPDQYAELQRLCEALLTANIASTQPAPVTEQEPIATVKVTNNGYGMMLSTYVAYALPEGFHDLYATPQPFPAPAVQSGEFPELPSSIIEFDTFLNEPPSYEQERMVRDYRHEAYAKWAKVVDDIKDYARQAIAQTAPAGAGEAIRDAVLEEAAIICSNQAYALDNGDNLYVRYGECLAAAHRIRALKTAAPSQGSKQ